MARRMRLLDYRTGKYVDFDWTKVWQSTTRGIYTTIITVDKEKYIFMKTDLHKNLCK